MNQTTTDMINSLLNFGPIALLMALLLALSYMIRASRFSNGWIPWMVAAAGPVLLQFMFPLSELEGKWDYPRFVIGVYGFIVAVTVWCSHEFLLSKFEDWLANRGFFPKMFTRSQTLPTQPENIAKPK